MGYPSECLSLQDGSVDLQRREVERGGGTTRLTTKESSLLHYLSCRSGDVVSRQELLEHVWGYNQQVSTRTIDITIRRLRTKIEVDAAEPRHIVTVHGKGYRFDAVSISTNSRRGAFPVDPATFIGRELELAALTEAFASGRRIVTLVGLGGQGKTRLARDFATRHLAGVPVDSAVFIDLTSSRSRTDMLLATGSGLGADMDPGQGTEALEAQLQAIVAGAGPLLCVFDNFEQIVDEAAGALSSLVNAAPNLLALTTSREALRIRGEKVVPLGPLPAKDAAALFVERYLDAGGEEPVSDPETVERLAQKLDDHPLALELAAARASELSVEELIERLDKRFEVLRFGSRDAPARHQTLWATIDWSWEMLSDGARSTLARCSVFPATFSLRSATQIAKGGGDTGEVEEFLRELQRKSLLASRVTKEVGRRYSLPVSIRDYASSRLGSDEERQEIYRRAAGVYCQMVEENVARLPLSTWKPAHAELNLELDNVLHIQREVASTEPELAARLGVAIHALLEVWAPWDLQLSTLDRSIESARRASNELLAQGLLHRARTYRTLGRRADAQRDLDEALSLELTTNEPLLSARAAHLCGLMCFDSGEHDRAREVMLDVVRRFERLERDGELAKVLIDLGREERRFGAPERHAEAIALLERALDTYEKLDHQRGAAIAHDLIGWCCVEDGHFDDAQRHIEASLEIHRARGELRLEAEALHGRAYLELERGNHAEARAAAEAVIELKEAVGAPTLIPTAEGSLALVALEEGDLTLARELFGSCSQSLRALDDQRRYGATQACAAAAEALAGELTSAEEKLREARAVLETHGGGWGLDVVEAFERLTACCCSSGADSAARSTRQEAVDFLEAQRARSGTSLVHRAALRILGRYVDA